jgi:L-threonylcarbamoyladenylate synthase
MESVKKQKAFIQLAIDALKEGKLVVYPTETLYGLGAVALDEKAVRKVFEVKHRPFDKPISIAVDGLEMMEQVAKINELALKLYKVFLPGPLTLILKSKQELPELLIKNKKVGIRVPSHPIALKLIKEIGAPLTSTSANLHGGESPTTLKVAKKQLGKVVAFYIEGGKLKGIPSTVVDLSSVPPKILRESIISKKEILKAMKDGRINS